MSKKLSKEAAAARTAENKEKRKEKNAKREEKDAEKRKTLTSNPFVHPKAVEFTLLNEKGHVVEQTLIDFSLKERGHDLLRRGIHKGYFHGWTIQIKPIKK